jgi:hypothetical protein
MRPIPSIALVTGLLVAPMVPAFGDTPAPAESAGLWECPQAGGDSIFTNRKLPGCKAIELKELSVVPPLAFPPESASANRTIIVERQAAPVPTARAQQIPDWGKSWYNNIAPSGSTGERVCALYAEWINLNERTRGGMFFGTDPNYGSDPTGRNQLSSSFPFYDNARWVTLSRLFGSGFVPVGCP